MLKLNVGLCKKVGEANYGSRGASVNVELELDSGLVGDAAKLKERIRQLFGVVRASLAEELNGNGQPSGDTKPAANQNSNGNGNGTNNNYGNGNGHTPASNQRNGGPRQATQSQVKAIHAIARSRNINVGQFLSERFRVSRPDELSIKTASQAIDEMKNADGNGG